MMWNKVKTFYAPVQGVRAATIEFGRPWRTGFWRRIPWDGLLALLCGLGCGIAAVVIAVSSDDKPLDYWLVAGYHVQPTVLLSVIITLGNVFLAWSFSQGVTIFFWTHALRKSSLRTLHSIHQQGNGFLSILTEQPVFNSVTVASFFMLILLMDGPLLQRSVSVANPIRLSSTISQIPISPSPFMIGTSGILPDHDPEPRLYHPLFAQVLQQYNNRTPITLPASATGCFGQCDTEITAPGWDMKCNNWTSPYRLMDFAELEVAQTSNTSQYDTLFNASAPDGVMLTQTMFSTNITYSYTQRQVDPSSMYDPGCQYHIEFATMYKSTLGGNGTLQWRNCTMSEALVRYPLHIENETVTIGQMPYQENRTVQLIYRTLEFEGQFNHPSTLGGFYLALNNQFKALANISRIAGWSNIQSDDTASSMYLQAVNASALSTYDVTWSDPIDEMINMIQELALRTAIKTTSEAPGYPYWLETDTPSLTAGQPEIIFPNLTLVNRTLHQTANVSLSYPQTVYKTERGWLAGGFAVVGLAFFAIIPMYWGWWKLGRTVTMSPLEIAKAFDSPLLRDADPNGTFRDLLAATGHRGVRYGVGGTADQEVELREYSKGPGFLKATTRAVSGESSLRSVSNERPYDEFLTGVEDAHVSRVHNKMGSRDRLNTEYDRERLQARRTLKFRSEAGVATPHELETFL